MLITSVMVVISIILAIGIPVIIFFAVKRLISYNSKLKRKKSMQQEELERMNIEDLISC